MRDLQSNVDNMIKRTEKGNGEELAPYNEDV
jgi:hypothetical protein